MDLRTKLLCSVLVLLLIGLGMLITLMGFTPIAAQNNLPEPGKITCTSLDIIDENGERRLSLSAEPSGGMMVVYGDGYFKSLLVLHGDASEGSITIHGESGKPIVSLESTPEGGAIGISENTKDANPKAMMIIKDKKGTFAVADENNKWYTSKQQFAD